MREQARGGDDLNANPTVVALSLVSRHFASEHVTALASAEKRLARMNLIWLEHTWRRMS